MELNAIWLENKVVVETENNELKTTHRIEKGQHIRVWHGTILDITEEKPANYTILSCQGTITSSQLEVHLIGNTGEKYKLILK